MTSSTLAVMEVVMDAEVMEEEVSLILELDVIIRDDCKFLEDGEILDINSTDGTEREKMKCVNVNNYNYLPITTVTSGISVSVVTPLPLISKISLFTSASV